MFANFYSGRRVVITGHAGFKGGWLSLWLKQLGAIVDGLGLGPQTDPSLYELLGQSAFDQEITCDVRDYAALESAVGKANPEIIFHLAALPLVRESYEKPVETFETNAIGTMNLLEAVRQLEIPCTVIVVTSDKCYENRGWQHGYREDDALGGKDVYSASKAAAELVVNSWRESFFRGNSRLGHIASARGGNVIGGGDYARDRIVPDCVRALLEQRPIIVRNPGATRPWQHVLDCLSGYLWLGACLARADAESPLASAFNFGPGPQGDWPVAALADQIVKLWPGRWEPAPGTDASAPRESERLNLAIDKAASLLDWFPVWDVTKAVQHTIGWYYQRHMLNKSDMVQFTIGQIDEFTAAALDKSAAWARSTFK
jgi:CDP-glucose 4,6-dehydratase